MGMDYIWAGTASYPRFRKEMQEVIAIFGGIPKEQITENKSSSNSDEWYTFTQDVPIAFKKWANHPYEDLDFNETDIVYNVLNSKRNEVMKVSSQIMEEFDSLHQFGDYWHIC